MNGSVIRKALLLAWIALLLVGGAGIDVAERCAAATARTCCCKSAVAKDRIEFKRLRLRLPRRTKAPAPERPTSRAEPVRDPSLRPGGDLVTASVPMHSSAPTSRRARSHVPAPRFVLYRLADQRPGTSSICSPRASRAAASRSRSRPPMRIHACWSRSPSWLCRRAPPLPPAAGGRPQPSGEPRARQRRHFPYATPSPTSAARPRRRTSRGARVCRCTRMSPTTRRPLSALPMGS